MSRQPQPGDYPITLYRGDTRIWRDEFADAATGRPLDLSGYTFRAQVRSGVDGAVIATMGIDDSQASNGVITRTLTAAQTGALTAARGAWDLELTSPDGFVRTYLAGAVRIRGDVSK